MFLILWVTMLIYNMLKQLLIIFSIIGLSYAQIQQGGSPKYYDIRINDINFIDINQNNSIDRNFHPMVFQFGNEYDVCFGNGGDRTNDTTPEVEFCIKKGWNIKRDNLLIDDALNRGIDIVNV